MKKIVSFLILVLCLVAVGCSSSRKGTHGGQGPLPEGSMESRFQTVADQRNDWECVAVPIKFELKSPSSISFSGKAYYVRGKEVFISLRKLLFEVAQLSVTPDTILLVDKFNGRHVIEDISELVKGAPVDIADLQALLMGQPFAAGKRPEAADFTYQDNGAEWYAIPRDESLPLSAGFCFNAADNSIKDAATRLFTVSYSGISRYGNIVLPDSERIKVDKDKIKLDAVISYQWDEAEWDNPQKIRHIKKPSSKSRRLDTASLLKSLGVR